MKNAKKFAFDVGWVFTGTIAVLLLHYLQKPIMARYLGPDGLGLYSMVTTVAGIIFVLADMGISVAIVKYTAEYKFEKNRLNAVFSSAFLTAMITGMVTGVVLFLLSDKFASMFNMPSLSPLIEIYALISPFSLAFGVLLGLFNGLREMKYYSLLNTLNSFLIFLFTLAFLFLGFRVKGVIFGEILAMVSVLILAIIIMKKFVHLLISNYMKSIKMLTSFGGRVMLGNVINDINNQTDILMIGYFLTAGDVGLYTVSVTLSRFFWRVPLSIQTVTSPATTEYWAKGDHNALNKMADRSMKYSACILLPTGLAVGFFSKDIITMIFGAEFIYAVLSLQILLIGTVIRGIIAQPIGGSLQSIGRPDITLKISVLVTVINILLSILFIPYFGIAGAALATIISLIIGSFIMLALTTKLLSIKVDTSWFSKYTGIVLLAIILFESSRNHINQYLLGGIILVVLLIIIFIFFLTKEDKNLFKSLISSFILRR